MHNKRPDSLFISTYIADMFTTGLLRISVASIWGFGISLLLLHVPTSRIGLAESTFFSLSCVFGFIVGILFEALVHLDSLVAYIRLHHTDPRVPKIFGARELSVQEIGRLQPILERVQGSMGGSVETFKEVFVIDSPVPSMFSLGGMLFISSSGIRSTHLGAMYTHELGHLWNGDSYTFLALVRFILMDFIKPEIDIRAWTTGGSIIPKGDLFNMEQAMNYLLFANQLAKLGKEKHQQIGQIMVAVQKRGLLADLFILGFFIRLLFMRGGGLKVKGRQWAQYFQKQDFLADAYAVQAGFEGELIAYLEEIRLLDSSVPYHMSLQPPVEMRIERLGLL